MRTLKLTPADPMYKLYIAFHTGKLAGADRQRAKALLHYIHYGTCDTSIADAEVLKIKEADK